MERLLVTQHQQAPEELFEFARTTRDGQLIDLDIFKHDSTFILKAFGKSGVRGYSPIAQPLMIEHLIFRPGLSQSETANTIWLLAEHTIEEAYRRDVGDVYFLGHDPSTCEYAERHGFKDIALLDPPLRCYRMSLRETFEREESE